MPPASRLAAAVLTLALASCAAETDPHKGGFFSGLKNLADGTYDRRVAERQTTLENEQDTNLQQNRALERAKEQSASVAADRKAAEDRYAAFTRELADLKKRLSQGIANNATKTREAADLTKRIAALEAKIKMVQQDSVTPDAAKAQRLDALKRESEALDREVEMLIHR